MAEYGEWIRKGASLTAATAIEEYGVSEDFLFKGLKAGKLEGRNTSMWGNPTFKILCSQLELYVAEKFGKAYLLKANNQTELKHIKKEINKLTKAIKVLQKRKIELETALNK
jgi:hypothetical protein